MPSYRTRTSFEALQTLTGGGVYFLVIPTNKRIGGRINDPPPYSLSITDRLEWDIVKVRLFSLSRGGRTGS